MVAALVKSNGSESAEKENSGSHVSGGLRSFPDASSALAVARINVRGTIKGAWSRADNNAFELNHVIPSDGVDRTYRPLGGETFIAILLREKAIRVMLWRGVS